MYKIKMMNSKKFLFSISLILSFVIIDVIDADAQRKRRRTREVEAESISVPIAQRITHSIEIGNFGFGSGFSISGKYTAGYKILESLQVGPTAKFFYNFVNVVGPSDQSFFDYGFGAMAKLGITRNIFLQGEYDYLSLDFDTERVNKSYPLVGGGYHDGRGPWTFGLSMLFILDGEVRDLTNNTVEYWISFNYNF
jgi:hypothetical protein